MATSMIKTVTLLTFIVVVQSAPTKTFDAKHLEDIYEACQETRIDQFCFGGRDDDRAFPEGTGCLRRKDCHAVVTGHRSGNTIEWTLLMDLDSGSEALVFQLISFGSVTTKADLRVFVVSAGSHVLVDAVDNNGKQIRIDSTNGKDIYKVKDLSVIKSGKTSPRMLMARLTSPTVISFTPNSWNVDTGRYCNAILYRRPKSSDSLVTYSANFYKFFDRGLPSKAITKKPTKPKKTPKKPKDKAETGFPGHPGTRSASRLECGQTIGLFTLVALSVFVSCLMQ